MSILFGGLSFREFVSISPDFSFYSTKKVSSLSKLYTAKGHYHEKAFAHLRDLRLKEKAIESGAQKLGAGVRRLLNEPFRKAIHAQKKGAA